MSDAVEEAPAHRFAAVLLGLAAVVLAMALLYADRVDSTRETDGGLLHTAVEMTAESGSRLVRVLDRSQREARLAGSLGLGLALALSWRRRRSEGLPGVAVALGLAWVAQAYLLDGFIAPGVALYAGAALVYAVRPADPNTPVPGLPAAIQLAALLVPFAVFLALAVDRLDVYPRLHLDETAYLKAAEMQAGLIEPRVIVRKTPLAYTFAQYRAQFVPLSLQAAALAVLEARVLTLRLVSVAAMAIALLVASLSLRRRLGNAATSVMLALCAPAPLWLAYSRYGFYVSISILHATLAFAALLRLDDRRDVPSAALLGLLLGGSLYFYQLSWFVPAFALGAVLVSPGVWRRPGSGRLALTAGVTALAVLSPSLGMEQGLRKVARQTFDDRMIDSFVGPDAAERTMGVLRPPAGMGAPAVAGFADEVNAPPHLRAVPMTMPGDRDLLLLTGESGAIDGVIARAEAASWTVLEHGPATRSGLARLRTMAKQLCCGPVLGGSIQWRDAPLLNPIVMPLVVLGLVEALRRRREPMFRILLLWVIAGAFLPGALGGPAPRRTVLMLPYAYALAALPVVELARGLARRGMAGRLAAGLAVAALLVAVVSVDTHYYFQRWGNGLGSRSAAPGGPAAAGASESPRSPASSA